MCILLIMHKGIANYITLAKCHWKSLHYFSVNILSKKIVIDKHALCTGTYYIHTETLIISLEIIHL